MWRALKVIIFIVALFTIQFHTNKQHCFGHNWSIHVILKFRLWLLPLFTYRKFYISVANILLVVFFFFFAVAFILSVIQSPVQTRQGCFMRLFLYGFYHQCIICLINIHSTFLYCFFFFKYRFNYSRVSYFCIWIVW